MMKKLLLSKTSFLNFSNYFSKKTSNAGLKLLCLGMFFLISNVHATDYYSKSTGTLNAVGTWGTALDGSGTSPANFTTAGNVFYIRNNAAPTIATTSWVVSGAGSKIVLGNGTNPCNFTIPGALTVTGSMDISSGATLTIASSSTSPIVFGTLATTSTVIYNRTGTQTILAGNYGNLTLSGSGIKTLGGAITTNGALTVSNNTSLAMSTYLLTLNGNLVETGTGTVTGGNGGVTISGSNTQSIAGFTTTGTISMIKNAGIATLTGIASGNSFNIVSGPYLNLGTFTHTTNTLSFAGINQTLGTWGSTSSGASNKNNNYFAASTGLITVGKTTYCTPTFTSGVRPITNVTFNTITNASSNLTNSQAYENYTNYSTNVIAGQSYTLTVKGFTNGGNTYNYTVYFDWNQDGDFADTGEAISIGQIDTSTGIDNEYCSKSISIPSTASLGTTRMRVVSRNTAGTNASCGTGYGQAEDYSVNIESPCSTPNPGNILTTANPVCANVPFTLSVENPSSGGATYQWETSTDNVSWISATPAPVTIIDTDFSTIPTNATILGANTKILGGELILTPSADSYTGGYLINTSPGSNITPFTASFNFRMYDGTAADGMSLSYGPDIALFSSGPGGGEEGEGTGFILKLDTFDNDIDQKTGSMIRIFYGGVQIFANSLNPFNLRDPAYRTATLAVDANGLLSFKIGSTTIVSGLSVPNYVAADKTNWKFKFSARSGGQYDKHSLNKILIQCGDVSSKNPTFTTSQTVPTYYQVKVTCGTTVISGPILITMPVGPTVVKSNNITCTSSRGSIDLSGLPSTGTWTITQSGTATDNITGTGTTYSVSNLVSGTYKFTLTNGTCTSAPTADVIISDQSSTAWNGSTWSAGLPDATKNVIFASTYLITADMSACACTVNSGVAITVPSGRTLNVKNAVTVLGTGSLTFSNNASLVQDPNTTVNSNVGSITYKRNTAPIRRYDFTYWSSPVNGYTLSNLIANTEYNTYDPTTGWVANSGSVTMKQGVGYSVLAPQTNSLTLGSIYNASFVGIPNNGNVNVTPTAIGWNLIGNPYPSTLDATKFIEENAPTINPTIEGTLYFWTHNTSPANTDPNQDNMYFYTTDDYAIFNLSGSVATSEAKSDQTLDPLDNKPTGNIASGQGFFVNALTTNPIKFTNSMRIVGSDNSQFFKTSNNAVKDRVWLNFKNKKGAFKQILIGYFDGATNSWDNNYDANTFNANPYIEFFSINETRELSIQGRALPFENTDQVPLGYVTTIDGEFTIAIDHTEGLFNNQTIYLEDKTTGAIHDLTTDNYIFKTETGTFPERFVLRYTNKTLGTGDFENLENGILVSVKNKAINVVSSKENIKEVSTYDITGKLLYNKTKVGNAQLQIQNLPSGNQVLLVKVTLENNFTTTQKIIFQ